MALYTLNISNSSNCSSVHIIGENSRANVILYVSVGSLVSPLIVVGNLLIIASIIKFPRLRTTANILIANLAVSDLMVGLFLLPVNITSIAFPHLQHNKYVCLIKVFNWLFTIGSSILNLCIISIDRLFAIVKPIKYRTFDSRTLAIVFCLVTWLVWTATCLILFGYFNTWQCNKSCTPTLVVSEYGFKSVAVFLGFVFLVSCGTFLTIVRLLSKSKTREIGRVGKDTNNKTRVMLCIFGLFVIFFIPLVSTGMYACGDKFANHINVIEWLLLFGAMNSFINSVIYGWKRSEFRKAYDSILKCSQNHDRVYPLANGLAVMAAPNR